MTDAVPTPRSYLPGEWYAVLGPSLVLALPPDRRDLAAAAWAAVDAGADADEVLDLVLAHGLRDLAGLALVSTEGDRARVLVRGQAVCLLLAGGEETVVDGRGLTTWAESTVEGVEAVSLELGRGAGHDGDPLVVGDALVRASRVLWPAEEPRPAAPPSYAAADRLAGPAALLADGAADPVATPADPPRDALEEPSASTTPDAPEDALEVHDPGSDHGSGHGSGPVVAAGAAPAPAPVEGDPLETAPASFPDPDGPPAPPVPPVPPAAWAPGADDHDGRTQDGSWSIEEFLRPDHAIPGQPPAPSVTARPVAVLQLSTGDRVDVDRVVILGRAPEARRFTATEQPRLVTVPSPQQEISSTHLEVRPGAGADHGSAVVTDLGSTNGTVLVQPGLPPESLRPGIPVQLLPGAVIDLGDGLSITVARP